MPTSLIILASFTSVDAAQPLRVVPASDPRKIALIATLPESVIRALPAGAIDVAAGERVLSLHLLDAAGKPGAAIFGGYRRDGRRLTFSPRFLLSRGRTYRAVLRIDKRKLSTDYRVPERAAGPPAVVERIEPASSRVPANLLKFYIHFSQPMREGRAIFDRIAILDESGRPVADPWRRTELWSADAKRFTLWIHPGRVKRGVNLRAELGPVLKPGRRYTLVVGPAVENQQGQPLGRRFTRTFHVVAADHRRPLPQAWKLSRPRTGTRDSLKIDFGEALDAALAKSCVRVVDGAGRPLAGRIIIDKDARSCSFHTVANWRSAKYFVKVVDVLEDLAGNTPERVFDSDLRTPSSERAKLKLPIRLRPGR